jgi:hypothetical protein
MPDAAKEQEYREEADRLAKLPPEDQGAVVAMYRDLAGNRLATPACRAEAKAKAATLARLLGLTRARTAATPSGKPKTGNLSPKNRHKRPACRWSLDSAQRCPKCFDRLCVGCGRPTGSYFITHCIICARAFSESS